MMNDKPDLRGVAAQLAKRLSDQGRLIAAGVQIFDATYVPPGTSAEQRSVISDAFMAGAQHLFASIMDTLDPGKEPTDADMRRMGLISAELAAWARAFGAKHPVRPGRN